ncbi:MAG: ATP-binding protein [Deltaproteobacteria bacterium]|nr:ATP-binding protein [Deltaproteobacteria bacterium]
MDRSLLLLLAVAVVNVVVVLRAPVPRAEKLGLLLFQLVLACVATGGVVSSLFGVVGAARSLLACAAAPLAIVLVRSPAMEISPRLATWGGALAMVLMGAGLVGEALFLSGFVGAHVAAVPAVVVVVIAGLLVQSAWQRRASVPGALARARAVDDAVAAGFLGVAALGAAVSVDARAWAPALGIAASLATASRVAIAPPDRRDVVVVVVGVALGALFVPLGLLPLLAGAVGVAVIGGRAMLVPPRSTTSVQQPLPGLAVPAGLGGLAPVLDDALLRRPGRPRVMARTPARRLLDAALERAQRAQPQHRGRPPIDVNATEGDADVDGDPSELAEALCVVLDNALRQQARHPWAKVSVVVRAATQTVSFEINDTAPGISESETPFAAARTDDVDRPGLGVSLARARLLVERHGGQLHARHGPEGSAVQLTLPRRLARSGVGVA